MASSVKVLNADRLKQKLSDLARLNVEQAVNKATLLVEGQAKALCPVDTGNLRESIHPKIEKGVHEVKGSVYTQCEYAAFVEFGTGTKGQGTYPYTIDGLQLQYRQDGWAFVDPKTGDTIWTHGQKAQPFMYPALKMNKDKIESILANSVKDLIKEAIQK